MRNRPVSPAGAGNMPATRWKRCLTCDHPRQRGDLAVGFKWVKGMIRSPSPARGGRYRQYTHAIGHPRQRGEHPGPSWEEAHSFRSPPPARGTHRPFCSGWLQVSFTPACAGNTQRPSRGGADLAVHPRQRGEHSSSMTEENRSLRSPPPARGAPVQHPHRPLLVPLTPACAGNTTGLSYPLTQAAAHPRLRGEHTRRPQVGLITHRSPPPARGTPRVDRGGHGDDPFTPACAGNTP